MPASVFHVFKLLFPFPRTFFEQALLRREAPAAAINATLSGAFHGSQIIFGARDRPTFVQSAASDRSAAIMLTYVWNVKLHNALSCKTKLFFAFGVWDEQT
jgi:hypothetical protein